MRRCLVVLLVACRSSAGPAQISTHMTVTGQLDDQGFHGLEGRVEAGVHGVELSLDLEGQGVTRKNDPDTHGAGGIDLGLRLSLFGMLAKGDHALEHWFDLGAEGYAGGGFTGIDTFGQASVGGWVEFGLWTGDSYPALILDVRRTVYSAPWNTATVFGVAFSFARRYANSFDMY